MVDPQEADPTRRLGVIVSVSDWDQLSEDEQDEIAGQILEALGVADSEEDEEE